MVFPAWYGVYAEANQSWNEGVHVVFWDPAIMTVNDRLNRHCATLHSGFD